MKDNSEFKNSKNKNFRIFEFPNSQIYMYIEESNNRRISESKIDTPRVHVSIQRAKGIKSPIFSSEFRELRGKKRKIIEKA